jgi:hypothetical protein
MKRCLLLVILFTAFLAACATPASAPSDDPTPEVTAEPTLETEELALQPLGEPFSLPIGETITLDDGGSITFEGVSEDSRCAEGIECVWAGQVIIDLTVTAADDDSEQASLNLMGGQSDPIIVGDYIISLLAVDPYPKHPEKIEMSAYVATLQVTSGATTPTDPAPTETTGEEGSLNIEFKLIIGETINLDDGGSVTFEGVSEDSRCPEEVDCVWAGQVTVNLTVTTPDGQSEELSLTLMGGQSEPVTVGDYTITLHAVDPYPKQPGDIDPASYNISIQLVKS